MQLFASVWPSISFTQLVFWALWVGLVALSVALVVMLYTRWGQSRPLGKCLVLSLFAHVLMGLYATTVQLRLEIPPEPQPITHVRLGEDPNSEETLARDAPWEKFDHREAVDPAWTEPPRAAESDSGELERVVDSSPKPVPGNPPIDHVADSPVKPGDPSIKPAQTETEALPRVEAVAVDEPQPQRRERPELATPNLHDTEPKPAGEQWRPEPERRQTAGVPESLLTHLAALPRLDEPPSLSGPAQALPDPSYTIAAGNRGAAPPDQRGSLSGRDGNANQITSPTPAPVELARQQGPLSSGGWLSARPSIGGGESNPALIQADPLIPTRRTSEGAVTIPNRYLLRTLPDKLRWAETQGATLETEAAVAAALRWLAAAQARDGRWDSSDHGGGREDQVLGRHRQNAGIEADAGVTGLALLAFLAAGHTHQSGEYQETVRRGLEYLLRIQAADGNLAGRADNFARMYCHAMAALAVTEALGMTGDPRLREPARRALEYTVACQSPNTGGWRYVPADPGDTSQLGWQWMALKSGELAGIPIPERTRQGVARFLRSVAMGTHGGLAAYRPGERPSRSMTAEALYCWMLLGLPADHPATAEAVEAIMGELPGQAQHNCYYWYYATLALYQLQNEHWRRWNDALTAALLAKQEKSGPNAGSWSTDTVWGGYGGRVYTTAISALTLEVYYRYLPLYTRAVETVGRSVSNSYSSPASTAR